MLWIIKFGLLILLKQEGNFSLFKNILERGVSFTNIAK